MKDESNWSLKNTLKRVNKWGYKKKCQVEEEEEQKRKISISQMIDELGEKAGLLMLTIPAQSNCNCLGEAILWTVLHLWCTCGKPGLIAAAAATTAKNQAQVKRKKDRCTEGSSLSSIRPCFTVIDTQHTWSSLIEGSITQIEGASTHTHTPGTRHATRFHSLRHHWWSTRCRLQKHKTPLKTLKSNSWTDQPASAGWTLSEGERQYNSARVQQQQQHFVTFPNL